jgi:hypothetical protein
VKQLFILDLKSNCIKQVFDNLVTALREQIKKGVLAVEVSDKKITRSHNQNRYFHKLVLLIAEQQAGGKATAKECERVKREIKHRIGLIEKEMLNGELITSIRSTADLSVDEFSNLIEQTISVCAFLEIKYPVPEFFGYDSSKIIKKDG